MNRPTLRPPAAPAAGPFAPFAPFAPVALLAVLALVGAVVLNFAADIRHTLNNRQTEQEPK